MRVPHENAAKRLCRCDIVSTEPSKPLFVILFMEQLSVEQVCHGRDRMSINEFWTGDDDQRWMCECHRSASFDVILCAPIITAEANIDVRLEPVELGWKLCRPDFDRTPRPHFFEVGYLVRKPLGRKTRYTPYFEHAVRGDSTDSLCSLVNFIKCVADALMIGATLIRQAETMTIAIEQCRAEPVLKRANMFADCGMIYAENITRAPNASESAGRFECT